MCQSEKAKAEVVQRQYTRNSSSDDGSIPSFNIQLNKLVLYVKQNTHGTLVQPAGDRRFKPSTVSVQIRKVLLETGLYVPVKTIYQENSSLATSPRFPIKGLKKVAFWLRGVMQHT